MGGGRGDGRVATLDAVGKRADRRWIALAIAALAVVAAALYLLLLRDRTPPLVERDPARRVERASRPPALPATEPAPDAPSLDYYVEPGVPARRVAGIVRRADGTPVAGARVELRSEWHELRGVNGPRTTTDDAGRFDFGEQPPTLLTVVASSPGDRPAIAYVDLTDPTEVPAPDAIELVLRACRFREYGRVRDAVGEPVAGARVMLVRKGHRAEWFVTLMDARTDRAGRFEMCTFDRSWVEIHADGYGRVKLAREMPRGGWDVVLTRGGAIAGLVVDWQSQPVAGARVLLLNKSLGARASYGRTVASGADGRFSFADVEPSVYEVTAEHPLHGWNPDSPSVTVEPGGAVTGVRIALRRCRAIAGIVLLDDDPVVGAVVRPAGVVTQTDGSFVGGCASVEAFDVEVEGFDVVAAHVPAGTEPLDDLVVRVRRRGGATGTVTADGRPVAGALVIARHVGDGDFTSILAEKFVAHTGASGAFRLTSLPPGAWELLAWSADRRRTAEPLQISVEGRSVREGIVLPLSRAAIVRGTLSDRDGVPIPGVEIHLFDRVRPPPSSAMWAGIDTTTDTGGAFDLHAVPTGAYRVCLGWCFANQPSDPKLAPVGGGAWPDVVVPRDDAVVELHLVTEARTTGTITGAVRYTDGAPVPFGRVRAWPNGGSATADASGAFEIADVPDGAYTVEAEDDRGARGEVSDVATGASGVEILLARPGAVRGTVENGDASCVVTLNGGAGQPYTERVAANPLAFEFDRLVPATYLVVARCGELQGSVAVTVTAGEAAMVTVRVGESAAVRVRVKEPDGGMGVSAGCMGAGVDAPIEDGVARLSPVPPGSVEVTCMSLRSGAALVGKAVVDVPTGGEVDVEVVLEPIE